MSASDLYAERAATSYQQQEIQSESPTALVARLYDMAGLEVARAQAAAGRQDWAVKGRAIHRASRCISHLQCSLNMDEGGDVARNLDRVYDYLSRRLTEANITNDGTIFEEIVKHLAELGSAWREIARRPRKADASAAEDRAAENNAVAAAAR